MAPHVAPFGAPSSFAVRPDVGAHRRSRNMRYLKVRATLALLAGLLSAVAASPLRAEASDPALLKRGEYLLRAGDCVACHTAPGGKPLAGGLIMETPFGIDLDAEHHARQGDRHRQLERRSVLPCHARGDRGQGQVSLSGLSVPLVHQGDARGRPGHQGLSVLARTRKRAAQSRINSAFPFNIRDSPAGVADGLLQAGAPSCPTRPRAPNSTAAPIWSRGLAIAANATTTTACSGRRTGAASCRAARSRAGTRRTSRRTASRASGSWSTEDLVTFLHERLRRRHGVALGPMKETIDNQLAIPVRRRTCTRSRPT